MGAFESSLAWLDLDEEARQKMQEQLALLQEPDTLDELGVGQVRDVFSGLFFPGTSTLWSRARYMLFVAWIYKQLEEQGTGRQNAEAAVRTAQKRLILALKSFYGEERIGIGMIGAQKDEPMRMPDELIWNGLHRWSVRVRDGSRGMCWRELDSQDARFDVESGDFGELLDAESGSWWHPRLPPAPDDFLERTSFDLDHAEASFLRDQLGEHTPDSLLAVMTQDPPLDPKGDFPWDNPKAVKRLSRETREAVDHARVFSYAKEGIEIFYSNLVAKKRESADAKGLAEDLSQWHKKLRDDGVLAELRAWNKRREAFWALVLRENPGLREGTDQFLDAWMKHAVRSPAQLLNDEDAERLFIDREWQVKRRYARLSNDDQLNRGRTGSPVGQPHYRFRQCSQIIRDVVDGLGRKSK